MFFIVWEIIVTTEYANICWLQIISIFIKRLTTVPKVMSNVKVKRAVYLSLGMIFHKVEKTLMMAKMHIKELAMRATISSQVLATAINEKLGKTKPIFEMAKARYEKLKFTIVEASINFIQYFTVLVS